MQQERQSEVVRDEIECLMVLVYSFEAWCGALMHSGNSFSCFHILWNRAWRKTIKAMVKSFNRTLLLIH